MSPRILTNVLRPAPKPWTKPTFDMPMRIDAGGLTPLGTDRAGFEWFNHRQYGELQASKRLIPEEHEPGNVLLTEVRKDGETFWQTYSVHAPGTYAQALEPPKPKAKPKARPIDALARFEILAAGERRDHSSRPAARGAEAILGRLASKDIVVTLAADGQNIVVLTPGGRDTGIAALVDAIRPLLVPYLHGGRAYCQVGKHETLVEAQTIALGGAAWCGACSPS